jgi:hypothetical protein
VVKDAAPPEGFEAHGTVTAEEEREGAPPLHHCVHYRQVLLQLSPLHSTCVTEGIGSQLDLKQVPTLPLAAVSGFLLLQLRPFDILTAAAFTAAAET